MKLPDLHARLLADVLALGSPYPLVITGGYGVQAHELLARPSQDVDVATENPAPMGDIVHSLAEGLTARGWRIEVIEIAPLSARLTATGADGQECEVDILKESFTRPPAVCAYGPVLSEQDVVGTKVRALAERGAPRDALDVFAASRRWTTADLEHFGRLHARGRFDLEELQSRLTGVAWLDPLEFEQYGAGEDIVDALLAWAQRWADDIGLRLAQDDLGDD
ncbi:nucleotidyl transferase AbiEii/AbiGii toxin family protein [Streptomyces abyssomicinicus]|uniref:nucleotidyl transferase AbiEii/AbiGii toxin family protein n=1 Tax=Streptomyces abyssomicinicus TaxID=574929 RepID=UPI001250508D|nr:nucleotidyl transferase AbiEii/AbiGii toxin family protein [Streptomyces abyssomicinicus]